MNTYLTISKFTHGNGNTWRRNITCSPAQACGFFYPIESILPEWMNRLKQLCFRFWSFRIHTGSGCMLNTPAVLLYRAGPEQRYSVRKQYDPSSSIVPCKKKNLVIFFVRSFPPTRMSWWIHFKRALRFAVPYLTYGIHVVLSLDLYELKSAVNCSARTVRGYIFRRTYSTPTEGDFTPGLRAYLKHHKLTILSCFDFMRNFVCAVCIVRNAVTTSN